MDAVKYVKALRRLCSSRDDCFGCPLENKEDCCCITDTSTEKAVQIVEEWAKEHPVKTRQSELLKLFPNTKIDRVVIIFCPRNFLPEGEKNEYCKGNKSCRECRKDYWLTEVTNND